MPIGFRLPDSKACPEKMAGWFRGGRTTTTLMLGRPVLNGSGTTFCSVSPYHAVPWWHGSGRKVML